jgi:hypothetical protein
VLPKRSHQFARGEELLHLIEQMLRLAAQQRSAQLQAVLAVAE